MIAQGPHQVGSISSCFVSLLVNLPPHTGVGQGIPAHKMAGNLPYSLGCSYILAMRPHEILFSLLIKSTLEGDADWRFQLVVRLLGF